MKCIEPSTGELLKNLRELATPFFAYPIQSRERRAGETMLKAARRIEQLAEQKQVWYDADKELPSIDPESYVGNDCIEISIPVLAKIVADEFFTYKTTCHYNYSLHRWEQSFTGDVVWEVEGVSAWTFLPE